MKKRKGGGDSIAHWLCLVFETIKKAKKSIHFFFTINFKSVINLTVFDSALSLRC